MNRKHGFKTKEKTAPEYASWSSIIQRCENKNNRNYADYGGRGIKICQSWRDDFINFLNDMGLRPSPRHTIERLNNDKGYSKENCVWALPSAQSINKRNNVWLLVNNKKMLLVEYAAKTGITIGAAHKRVQRARANGTLTLSDGSIVLESAYG